MNRGDEWTEVMSGKRCRVDRGGDILHSPGWSSWRHTPVNRDNMNSQNCLVERRT